MDTTEPSRQSLPRVPLVHGPTPLVKRRALDRRLGIDLFIKCDDATGGATGGNKIRKLEFLLGDAIRSGADVVLTCGGLQSNHARATALSCAALGLSSVLFLRVGDELASPPDVASDPKKLPLAGNVLLDRFAGAEVRLISRRDYAERSAVMEAHAARLRSAGRRPYVIPEGGSNALGSLGYVEAMREVRAQLEAGLGGGPSPFDVVVHACGSGGTAAGVTLGAAKFGVAKCVRAVAVCDDAAYFTRVVETIHRSARAFDASLDRSADLVVDESARGPGYGIADAEQRRSIVLAAREAGLVLDPVYTGKAFFGLERAVARGDIAKGSRVLFLHTGGLPGLLAQGEAFAEEL
jgi:D-cysteine desulfhydrase